MVKEKKVRERRTYPQVLIFLGSGGGPVDIGEAVLVHDPIGFDAFGGFTSVENECLFNPECLGLSNVLVSPGRLPVPGSSCPVRP